MSNETRSKREVMLMNPETGSVDSEGNWKSDMHRWGEDAQDQYDQLIEVRRVEGEWIEDREIEQRGITPLHLAACDGDSAEMGKLIRDGAQVDITDKEGKTPLSYLVGRTDLPQSELEKSLVAFRDAGVSNTDRLHFEANVKTVSTVVKVFDSDLETKNEDGKTALEESFEGRNMSMASALLEMDCSAKNIKKHLRRFFLGKDAGDDDGIPPQYMDYDDFHRTHDLVFAAASNGHSKALSNLADEGVDLDAPDSAGRTPLQHALIERSVSTSRLLITAGADVNAQDENGATPLHYSSGSIEATALLLEAGADPRIADNQQDKPADFAEVGGNAQIAGLLVNKEQELDRLENHGAEKEAQNHSREELSM